MKFKKIICLCLSTLLLKNFTVPILANNLDTKNFEKSLDLNKFSDYSVEDIKKLEPYIIAENNSFKFDVEKALEDGFDKDLVMGQELYLSKLNDEAKNGYIEIHQNLEITSKYKNNLSDISYKSCDGMNTEFEKHWWGFSRYADNCDTKRIINELNYLSAKGGLVASLASVVQAFFPQSSIITTPIVGGSGISIAYIQLLTNRLDANNEGKGVYIEMTWVGVFDITPQ